MRNRRRFPEEAFVPSWEGLSPGGRKDCFSPVTTRAREVLLQRGMEAGLPEGAA